MALSEIHPGYGEVIYNVALNGIVKLGAGWVLLPIYGYMDSAAAAVVDTTWEPPVSSTEYREFVRGLVRDAHAKGLSVLLVPYLNLRFGSKEDWRGNIRPSDWNAWFESYRRFLEPWVRMAAAEKVEMLAAGAELVSTENDTGAWRNLLARIRKEYRGRLIYSFNWDHYDGSHFYADLDAVGVSGYYSLPRSAPLTAAAIEENWRNVKARLVSFSHSVHRPVLFTEVGYASVEGAARDPWNYMMEGPPDTAGQAQAIAAFIRAWDSTPELEGVFFWNYSPMRGGALDTSYSIRDKPAETIIHGWFRRFPIALPRRLR